MGRRRWTLVNAMTDEGMSDVELVRELESMREVAEWARKRERERVGHTRVAVLQGQGEEEVEQHEEPEGEWDDGWDEWDVGREILEGRDWLDGERQKEKEMRKERAADVAAGGAGGGSIGHGQQISESPPSDETGDPIEAVVASTMVEVTESSSSAALRPPRTSSLTIASTPSPTWLSAQRALLTCRELILTERRYLTLLSTLVRQETATTVPPLMVHYANELLKASEAVLRAMEREPSARGVARAFVEREGDVEEAYVKWCGVVGGWFAGEGFVAPATGAVPTALGVENDGELLPPPPLSALLAQSGGSEGSAASSRSVSPSSMMMTVVEKTTGVGLRKRKVVKYASVDDGGATSGGETSGVDQDSMSGLPNRSSRKSGRSSWRKSMPSIPSIGLSFEGGPGKKEKGKERDEAEDGTPDTGHLDGGKEKEQEKKRRKPAVRDLAILPTQRVMRYVLLYRDLLSHTPPSSASRAFVERAVDAACRIADKCDRAQDNAAFMASASKGDSGSRTGSKRGGSRKSMPSVAFMNPSMPPTQNRDTPSSVPPAAASSSSCSGGSSSEAATNSTAATSVSTPSSVSFSPPRAQTLGKASGRSSFGASSSTSSISASRRASSVIAANTGGVSLVSLGRSKNPPSRAMSLGAAAENVQTFSPSPLKPSPSGS